MSQAVYTKLMQHLHLDREDREQIRQKRGFTDNTIDTLRFVSGGTPAMAQGLDIIRTEFSEDVLVASGVFEIKNGTMVPSDLLLSKRIIIPYLDVNGDITLLRPHKLGLKDIRIQVYCELLLKDNPEHVVLTEGEFKAAALYQWGIPAIAIPGISSFAGKHFERLADMLKRHKVQKVTIIYDNEIKNSPQYPNYKEKPEDRWDTPFWAYI